MFDHEEIKLLKEILAELVLIRVILEPKRLSFAKIAFSKGKNMATVQGPVVLNSGQTTIASVNYYDQNGSPMPATFVPPPIAFTIDHPEFASSTPNPDQQTDPLAYVSAGVANLTIKLTSAEGLAITDTETVTCNAAPPPPPPVLSSAKIAFSTPQ